MKAQDICHYLITSNLRFAVSAQAFEMRAFLEPGQVMFSVTRKPRTFVELHEVSLFTGTGCDQEVNNRIVLSLSNHSFGWPPPSHSEWRMPLAFSMR